MAAQDRAEAMEAQHATLMAKHEAMAAETAELLAKHEAMKAELEMKEAELTEDTGEAEPDLEQSTKEAVDTVIKTGKELGDKAKGRVSRFFKKIRGGVWMLPIMLGLALGAGSTVSAEEYDKTIEIDTVEEFLAFAENCRLDVYSEGLYVELTADIDLQNEDFPAIPTFSGYFDGRGHAIKGLAIKHDGSYQGLFRYVEEGAVVCNLNVEGEVQPTGRSWPSGRRRGRSAGRSAGSGF